MLIILYILSIILFLFTFIVIFSMIQNDYRNKGHTHVLINGIKEGLKGSGLNMSGSKYTVELYRWEIMDDDEVCDDCLERATWPPMDIADWMKVGLPGTPEAQTHCGEHCRCELVLHESKPLKHLKNNH